MAGKTLKTLILISLIALAATGCSDDSPTAPVAAIDTAPPAVPANLEADYSDNTVAITWDANVVDLDLAGYVVEKDYRGNLTQLTPNPIQAADFQDTAPGAGANQYFVYAVDTSGNASAVATVYVNLAVTHAIGELSDN